jgi:hypothetical protein
LVADLTAARNRLASTMRVLLDILVDAACVPSGAPMPKKPATATKLVGVPPGSLDPDAPPTG